MDTNFEIYPQVLPIGTEAEVLLRAKNEESKFNHNSIYTIRLFSKVNYLEESQISIKADSNGNIRFPLKLNTYGEYLFNVYPKESKESITTGHLFAVTPELIKLKPFRGDMHIHTHYSDGRQTPIYMAIKAKKLGLDFIAITDHNRYQPSIEAIEEANKIGLDVLLMEGEEVTVRDNCGHIVAVCTSDWVAREIEDLANYEKERQDIIDNDLKDLQMVDGMTKEHYSHSVWVINKIREFGGYAVIAHPYWVAGGRFHLDRLIYEQLLKDERYDAIEVLGDVVFEDNILSVVRYYEAISEGRKIPIIGNSDTHDSEHTYGRYWTIAFAEKLDKKSIWDAILQLRSVACEHHPDESFRAFGSFNLVEYAFFLEREFFPIHNAICQKQGDLYMRLINEQDIDQSELDTLKEKLSKLYESFFWNKNRELKNTVRTVQKSGLQLLL